MNWMAINTDSKKIEKICNGIVPGPNDNLEELIQQHDRQEKLGSNVSSTSTNRSSMVKDLWAKKGVTFPGTGPLSPPTPRMQYVIPAPQTEEEENYQINLAMRESERESSVHYHSSGFTATPSIQYSNTVTCTNLLHEGTPNADINADSSHNDSLNLLAVAHCYIDVE